MKVWICGGTDYRNIAHFILGLRQFERTVGTITQVITDGTPGVAALAEMWAMIKGVDLRVYPNGSEIWTAKIDAILKFPGGVDPTGLLQATYGKAIRVYTCYGTPGRPK
jgi:hypothetical protein